MPRWSGAGIDDLRDCEPGIEDFGHRVTFGASCLLITRCGFVYEELPPPPTLRDVIACTWSSQVLSPRAHRLRVVPDGCTELVYSPDHGTLVYGPGLDWSDVPLEPHARRWGIRLMPAAASSALQVNMSELAGRVVVADDLAHHGWGNQPSPDAWLTSAMAVITARISVHPPDWVAASAAKILTDRPRESLSGLAKSLGVSERQLRRRFTRSTGIAPASYRRIVRMRDAVAKAHATGSSWAGIAYESGFSDQSHLTRELRSLTGMSPNKLSPIP